MKRLLALFALVALILAPAAFAPASAGMSAHGSHGGGPAAGLDHRQQPAPHKVDASCCPAAAPATLAATIADEPRRIAPPSLVSRGPLAPIGEHPVIEIPPPRS
jgi:hypothetical protein